MYSVRRMMIISNTTVRVYLWKAKVVQAPTALLCSSLTVRKKTIKWHRNAWMPSLNAQGKAMQHLQYWRIDQNTSLLYQMNHTNREKRPMPQYLGMRLVRVRKNNNTRKALDLCTGRLWHLKKNRRSRLTLLPIKRNILVKRMSNLSLVHHNAHHSICPNFKLEGMIMWPGQKRVKRVCP